MCHQNNTNVLETVLSHLNPAKAAIFPQKWRTEAIFFVNSYYWKKSLKILFQVQVIQNRCSFMTNTLKVFEMFRKFYVIFTTYIFESFRKDKLIYSRLGDFMWHLWKGLYPSHIVAVFPASVVHVFRVVCHQNCHEKLIICWFNERSLRFVVVKGNSISKHRLNNRRKLNI